jgi:hypothetical protein
MKVGNRWGLMGIALGMLVGLTAAASLYADTPWDWAKRNNCSIVGCNGCGSYNNERKSNCGPKERYCTYKCEDGSHNSCMQDDGC